jgi:hypothetical protein
MTTTLSTPPQVGLVFRVAPDGSLLPSDIPSGGAAGLGILCCVVINFGTAVADLGMAGVAAFIQANASFPLPFARHVVDWQKLKTAAAAGQAYSASTF